MNAEQQQFHNDVHMFLDRIKVLFLELADAQGLTRQQLATLFAIERNGELPMGKTAGALHCDASNITGIVDRLVAQNFIDRRELPHDRRTKTLSLTAKGKKAVSSTKIAMIKKLGYAKLSTSEKETLHIVVNKICN